MPAADEVPLTAVLLPRSGAAAAVTAAWDAGEAVTVLDPAGPTAALAATLDRLRPTHLLDGDGRRPLGGGVPVAAGVCAVVVTSGTTAAPKGVELTTAGLETIGRGCNAAIGAGASDRWLLCLPLHHVAGLAILARARASGAAVTVDAGFEPDAVACAPRERGATLVSLVPTMLKRLLDAGAPLADYRALVVGGAPMPPAVRARAREVGAPVVDAYGMSESWGGVVLDGVPIAGMEATLDDGDDILLRGPAVMRGYRLAPRETREAFTPDGWLRTGDVGTFDDGGRLRVVDRRRDIIITGGVNVSPTEVEVVLAQHPAIADVGVAGVPDDEWGERVVAFVVTRDGDPTPSLGDVRAFASERLSAPKVPRQVVGVAEIPRSPGGKVLRRLLPAP
ncbi:MAG TPA: AMP-binding protein [Acidimicrobiia bacterium]|nr:AMP-binding protein [Acidimicrobiia bacterium]